MLVERLRRWLMPSRSRGGELAEADWQALLGRLPFLRGYDPATLARLRSLVPAFLRAKSIEPAGGLVLTDAMCRIIAVQACLPILGLGLGWYRGWRTVVVYPGDFLVDASWMDEAGVVHEGTEVRAGEAWQDGPVVISWAPDNPAGVGVVIHEFAHKLDMRNGVANGRPPLHRDMDPAAWTRAFEAAYEDFTARYDQGEALPFDAYAATDPAEFFAVASEVFLLDPARVRRAYPAVYQQLARFYRWVPGETPPVSGKRPGFLAGV